MDFHAKSYKSLDPGVPIQSLISRSATFNTNCKLGLPVMTSAFFLVVCYIIYSYLVRLS